MGANFTEEGLAMADSAELLVRAAFGVELEMGFGGEGCPTLAGTHIQTHTGMEIFWCVF